MAVEFTNPPMPEVEVSTCTASPMTSTLSLAAPIVKEKFTPCDHCQMLRYCVEELSTAGNGCQWVELPIDPEGGPWLKLQRRPIRSRR